MAGTVGLDDLPRELICEVFAQLPASTLVKTVQLVCQAWRQLATDDFVWRRKLQEDLGKAQDHSSDTSCYEQYQELSLWRFDPNESGMGLIDECKVADNLNLSDFAAAISNHPLTEGVHYFQFEPLLPMDTQRCFGVGIATPALIKEKSFFRSNKGIGWYNCGTVYNLGDEVMRLPKFKQGDKCGVLVDLERLVLQYFFNGKRLDPEIAINLTSGQKKEDMLHAVVLLSSNQARIEYFGRRIPPQPNGQA